MTTANDIWLIAGLGNPEAKYDGTRHNAGFAALDALAAKWGISVNKSKFQGLWGQGEVEGHKVVLLKPLTYMNLSGDSIAPLAGFFKIPADHVIVLCDDITQAPGKLRIRPSGSAGGHNGLKSIIARLGGENFPRIRLGVVNWSQAMQPHCFSGICSAGRRMCAGAKQVVVFMVDSSLSRIIKDNYCITQPETRSVSKRSAACTVRFSTPASVAAVSSACRASASMAASEVTSRFCTPRVRAGTSSATLLFLH